MKLQVLEHEVAEGETLELEAAHRVVYRLADEDGEYTAEALTLTGPTHVLAFELSETASPAAKLSAEIDVDLRQPQLIRLDRVSFPPGGVAYLHVHRGPGIRVLLNGEIRIDTDGQSHTYGPLGAWFEAGPIPVFAAASETEPTAFVRCMVLPAELQGKRSITYVRDEDKDKPKPQEYKIFVDQPLSGSPVLT